MNTSQKAGRKLKYGEPTTLMRVPNSMIPTIEKMLEGREVLEAQWQSSQLPPKAQRFLELITDRMLFTERALIGTFREIGTPGFLKEVDLLEKQLNEDRVKCLSSNTSALLSVLTDDDEQQAQEEQLKLSRITKSERVMIDGHEYLSTSYNGFEVEA
jgi:hypothetical protein